MMPNFISNSLNAILEYISIESILPWISSAQRPMRYYPIYFNIESLIIYSGTCLGIRQVLSLGKLMVLIESESYCSIKNTNHE